MPRETADNGLPQYDLESLYPNKKRLSSTQIIDYIDSPQGFYAAYVLGNRRMTTVPMQIGIIFAALYENRDLDFEPMLKSIGAADKISIFKQAMKMLPVQKGGYPEYPLIATYRGWEIRATLDDYLAAYGIIIENKTGCALWDQNRVNDSFQLTIQQWCFRQNFGAPPKQHLVNWLDLNKNHCRIVPLKAKRSVKELDNFTKIIDLVIDNLEANNFTRNIYE